MSSQPMLGPRALPVSDIGCRAVCRASAARWWATTTAEEFLSSPVSRRGLWKFYYIVAGLGLLIDVFSVGQGYAHTVLSRHRVDEILFIDLSEALFSLLLRWLPVRSLKSDLVILAGLLLQFNMYLRLEANDDPEWIMYPSLGYKLILCYAFGVHSLCTISYGAVSLLLCASRCNFKPESTTFLCEAFCMVVLIMAVMTVLEGLLAYHYRELRERLAAIQNLLDKATDGFCTVGRSTGTVTDVSQSLMHLLGTGLQGAQILNFVDPSDRAKVARLFNDSWSDTDIAGPVLATFSQRRPSCREAAAAAVEFEAKLVPYRATDTDVHVVFQIVGEIRSARHLPDAAARPQLPDAPAAARPVRDRPAGRETTLDHLRISFDSGHPNFLIGDSECSRELLPRKGKLIHWFPRHARFLVERWITNSVNHCDEEGLCPKSLENFEIVLPPVPAIKIKASKAYLVAEQPITNEDGSVSLPAVLCLMKVTISQSLPAIPEELLPEADREDGLTSEGSESVTGSDSASVAMTKFREVANPSFSSSSTSADRPPG